MFSSKLSQVGFILLLSFLALHFIGYLALLTDSFREDSPTDLVGVITVSGSSLDDQISLSGVAWHQSDIEDLSNQTWQGEVEYQVFDCSEEVADLPSVWSHEYNYEERIAVRMARDDFRPANILELLEFTRRNPDAYKSFSLMAVGSNIDAFKRVDGEFKYTDASWWDKENWTFYYYPVVRKVPVVLNAKLLDLCASTAFPADRQHLFLGVRRQGPKPYLPDRLANYAAYASQDTSRVSPQIYFTYVNSDDDSVAVLTTRLAFRAGLVRSVISVLKSDLRENICEGMKVREYDLSKSQAFDALVDSILSQNVDNETLVPLTTVALYSVDSLKAQYGQAFQEAGVWGQEFLAQCDSLDMSYVMSCVPMLHMRGGGWHGFRSTWLPANSDMWAGFEGDLDESMHDKVVNSASVVISKYDHISGSIVNKMTTDFVGYVVDKTKLDTAIVEVLFRGKINSYFSQMGKYSISSTGRYLRMGWAGAYGEYTVTSDLDVRNSFELLASK